MVLEFFSDFFFIKKLSFLSNQIIYALGTLPWDKFLRHAEIGRGWKEVVGRKELPGVSA